MVSVTRLFPVKGIPIALLVVLVLSGCVAAQPASPPTASETTRASSAGAIPESKYFAVVRESVPTFKDVTDEQLRSGGQAMCTLMDQNPTHPWASAFAELTRAGLGAVESGAFIAASVAEYCPANLKDLPR